MLMKSAYLSVLLCSVCPIAGCQAAESSGVAVVELRCDYRVNPLGIDRFPPKLSWRMDAASGTGTLQTAYRIRSAASLNDLAEGETLWDSGLVESGASASIPYGGPKLKPGQRIWWQVRIHDNQGNESDWSEPGWFEAGLLDEKHWQNAEWIASDRDPDAVQYVSEHYMGSWIQPPASSPVSRLFRDVELPDKKIVSAIARWGSSKGLGALFLFANYDTADEIQRNHMDTMRRSNISNFYDLAFYLKPGVKNRIGIRFEKPISDFALTYGMRILFADGTEMTVRSDEHWQGQIEGDPVFTQSVTVAEPYGGPSYGKAREFNMTDLPPAWFRGSFAVKGNAARARLYLCALGQGKPYINGHPVDDSVMGVPQTDYEEFAYYTVHDITDFLRDGINTVSVLLDAGWYHQVGGFDFSRFTYGQPGLKALIAVDDKNGSSHYFVSGSGWEWKEGVIRSANIYRGSIVDYRLDHDEWKSSDAGTGWKPAQIISPRTPKTTAMDVHQVRRGITLTPVRSWQTGPKSWLFDIGETIHGWVRFSLQEAEGTTIYLRYSEYAENGMIENVPRSHWWCHRMMQSDWIYADGRRRVFEPAFTPKSFRFVEVCGLSDKPEDLAAFTIHSDIRPLVSFESSNPMLNRLFENGMRTWRNYIVHVLNDMPRERCLWGAESIYTEIVGTHCFDLAANHRLMNTLWLTGPTTNEGIPGNIGVGKRLTTRTQGYIWSVTPVFLASKLYEHYGDLEPAQTYYEKLRIIIDHPKHHGKRDGTIGLPNELADHAPIFAVRRHPVDNDLLTAMIYYEALQRFIRLADAIGKAEDTKDAQAHLEKVHETIMSFYDHENHTFKNGTQDSLALAFNVIKDPAEQERLAQSLAGHYKTNGHRWDGGFLSYEVYPQLSRFGYVDDAVKMLTNTTSPGPAQSVADYDATTFFETYHADRDNQMRVGQNFVAFTHSIGWMITDLAGIRYKTPAGSRTQLKLCPQFAGELEFVKARAELPTGMVRSKWKRRGDQIIWNVTIPPNTETTVELSVTNKAKIAINGRLLGDTVADRAALKKRTFELDSGNWEIVISGLPN